MQINNLTIKAKNGKWQVVTPDKRVLEEFTLKSGAVSFAQTTRDFLRKQR